MFDWPVAGVLITAILGAASAAITALIKVIPRRRYSHTDRTDTHVDHSSECHPCSATPPAECTERFTILETNSGALLEGFTKFSDKTDKNVTELHKKIDATTGDLREIKGSLKTIAKNGK